MTTPIRVELPEWMHTALAAGWTPPYFSSLRLDDADGSVDPRRMRQQYHKRRAWELANPHEDKVAFNEKYETRAL